MITVHLKEGILQLSKKQLGVFVQKSTFPDIHQNDEVVEINNLRSDIFNEVTLWPKPPTEMTVVKLSYINLS